MREKIMNVQLPITQYIRFAPFRINRNTSHFLRQLIFTFELDTREGVPGQ